MIADCGALAPAGKAAALSWGQGNRSASSIDIRVVATRPEEANASQTRLIIGTPATGRRHLLGTPHAFAIGSCGPRPAARMSVDQVWAGIFCMTPDASESFNGHSELAGIVQAGAPP